MPDNEFLPYAGDAGANVEPQADYAADPKRTEGQQTGIANSPNANKAWRQATAIASALAQLVVNTLTVDMLDNGDQADKITKLGNLITGLSWLNPVFSGTVDGDGATSFLVPTVAGTTENSTKAASTGFVQAVRALLATLASPAFTGVPTAPTAAFGTNTTQISTTAFVQAALALTLSYNSGNQTIAFPGTVGPLTHSLGGKPRILQPWLICLNADQGYVPGDTVQCPSWGSFSGENRGIRWLVSATTISGRIGADAIILPNASTGTPGAIDATKWDVYVNAFI